MKFLFGNNFISFLAGPDPGYYLNEKDDLDFDEEFQCVHFDNTISLTVKRI